MEYLPSKLFVVRMIALLALAGGMAFFMRGSVAQEGRLAYKGSPLVPVNMVGKNTPVVSRAPKIDPELTRHYLRLDEVDRSLATASLATNPNANTTDVRAYSRALVTALQPFSVGVRENEAEIMFQVLEQKETAKIADSISKLKALSSAEEQSVGALERMAIPEDIAPLHRELTSSVARTARLVSNMAGILEDPVLAIASANEYVKESKTLGDIFAKVNAYFDQRGIVFEGKDRLSVILYEIQ